MGLVVPPPPKPPRRRPERLEVTRMGSRHREFVDGLCASASSYFMGSSCSVAWQPEPREVVVRHVYEAPPTWECRYCGSSQTFDHEKCIGCGSPMVKPKEREPQGPPKGPTMHTPATPDEVRIIQERKKNIFGRPKAWKAICEHCGTLFTKLPSTSKCKQCGGRVITYREPRKGDRR